MPNKVILRAGDQTWSGPTLKAARFAQQVHLETLFGDAGEPIVLALPDGPGVLVISQSLMGDWGYAFHRPTPGETYRLESRGSSCSGWSREQAEFRARRHLAQNAYVAGGDDGSRYLHAADAEGRREHARWCAFQHGYHEARVAGASDADAHAAGCRASSAVRS